MPEDVPLGHDLFGYTILVRDREEFIALKGDGVPDLRVGMSVVLLGDSRGYVPSGHRPGAEVRIVGFVEPFKKGESDHIIEVTDGKYSGRVKPSNIQRNIAGSHSGADPYDARHQQMRGRVHPSIGDLMDAVYVGLSAADRQALPDQIGTYVDAIVAHALAHLSEFAELLAETIARVHAESPGGERFIRDPRSSGISNAILFLTPEGQLATVKHPNIVWTASVPRHQELKGYQSYEVLTGPSAGRRFNPKTGALRDPIYREGVASALAEGSGVPETSDRIVKVRTHRAHFIGESAESYFVNITNLSPKRVVEVTHVWYEDSDTNIPVEQPARKLPVRLELDESWETWIPVAALPSDEAAEAYDSFRVRISSGVVFSSERNTTVPLTGTVPGAGRPLLPTEGFEHAAANVPLLERWLVRLKNHPAVAGLVLVVLVVTGASQVSDAVDKLRKFISGQGVDQPLPNRWLSDVNIVAPVDPRELPRGRTRMAELEQQAGCDGGLDDVEITPSPVRARVGTPVTLYFDATPICMGQAVKQLDATLDWGTPAVDDRAVLDALFGRATGTYLVPGEYVLQIRASSVCYDYGAALCHKAHVATGHVKVTVAPDTND